jgi:dephospho-CoA kinase
MLRVGLTGGFATGKSFVGEAFAELGCHLIKADELGHQVLEPGGEAYDAAVREFGAGILGAGGAIDRRKLAALVFDKPERLAVLNHIVHPPVIRREEELIAQFAGRDPHGIVMVEAAILIETGSHKRFDRLVLAVCSREQQIERAMRRDELTYSEVLARLDRQMPLEEKRKLADYVIDTSGSKDDTRRQAKVIYESLRSIAQ